MSKTNDKEPYFKPEIPEPTEADLKWAEKIKKKGFGWFQKGKIVKIVNNNELWRMNFLHETYGDKLNLSFWKDTGSGIDNYLIGRAVWRGYSDMTLLLAQFGARSSALDDIWRVGASEHKCPKMCYALLLLEKDCFRRFQKTLEENFFVGARTCIEMNFVACDNKALQAAIKCNRFDIVTYMIAKGDQIDLAQDDYQTIREAEEQGFFDIVSYLKEMADPKENTVLALPVPDVLPGSDTYEKLSDVELLKTSVSKNGSVTLTTIFNFEIEDITRTQYIKDQAPSETLKSFNELRDVQAMRPMFDKLRDLGGNPPSDIFKSVDKVKIDHLKK